MNWTFVGSESITTTGTSAYVLTPPSSLGFIQRAVLELVGSSAANDILYYTFDGTTPSSSNGNRIYTSASAAASRIAVEMGMHEIEGCKIVSSTAGLYVHVDYYG